MDIRLDLLDLYGSGYVIEHCVAALSALRKQEAFEAYVTDCLKLITENTAMMARQGRYITARYADVVKKEPEKKEERSAEEIIAGIKGKMAQISGREEVTGR